MPPSDSHFQQHIDKAAVLLEALPYLQRFRGETFLIKVGGSAMDDPQRVRWLMRDIVFLEVAGINPVLVHGGGRAISAAMKAAGLEARFVEGHRVTTEEAIDVVAATLNGKINPGLVASLESFGGRAVGVPGTDVFVGERRKHIGEDGVEIDLGRVGEVVDFRIERLEAAMAENVVPVVSPLAAEGADGQPLNVNADLAAAALAGRLAAAKLVYLSDVLGVMRDAEDPATLIPSISSSEVEVLVDRGVISGGMIPKLRSSVDALHAGVGKVHMVDGRISHSLLLEIFTDVGIGTEVVS